MGNTNTTAQSGTDDPNHMMSCSATKAQGKEEEGRTFVVMVFVFPSNRYAKALLPKQWLGICDGK